MRNKAVNGTNSGKSQSVLLPLSIDKQPQGEIQVLIPEDWSQAQVEGPPLLKLLEKRVKIEVVDQLKKFLTSDGYLSIKVLKTVGLEVELNQENLEMLIQIPAAIRPISELYLSGRGKIPLDAYQAIKPSGFSAFINLRSGVDYVEQSQTGRDAGVQPVRFSLEGGFHIGNFVLESDGRYEEASDNPWQRGNTRLVHDIPERRLRLAIGDLSYPITSLQSYQPLMGFSLARKFSLQPYRVTTPLGNTSFFLKSPSKVEVLVNGRPMQTLQLPAGPHQLSDFQFASGANDIVLKITDDVGRVETVNLSYFFDYQLLAKNEQEFAYNLGVSSSTVNGNTEYEIEIPSLSLFHRYGISDTLTAGMNFQGSEEGQILGGETLWASRLGTFQNEIALSQVENHGYDFATRFQYRYYDSASKGSAGNTWSFSALYRGDAFGGLGNLNPKNNSAVEFSARFGRRLPWNFGFGMGGTYQINRNKVPNTHGANVLLSRSWNRGFSTDVNFDYRVREDTRTEFRVYLSFAWSFGQSSHSLRGSFDSLTETERLDWQYNPARTMGSINASAGVQNTPDNVRGVGSIDYSGNRYETTLSHDVTTPTSSGGAIDSRSSFRMGTALVLADGHFAVSRPVQDSFAIVVPHPALQGQKIGIDPVQEKFMARADRLGPGVLPQLQSYQVRRILIDAPDLPLGYELGQDVHTVWPTYKSGTVIHVGTGATVVIDGILENGDGTLISLQAGKVISLDDPQWKPVTLFTNRRGRFQQEGFQTGRYELTMLADPKIKLQFEIPKNKMGLCNLGILRFKETIRFE